MAIIRAVEPEIPPNPRQGTGILRYRSDRRGRLAQWQAARTSCHLNLTHSGDTKTSMQRDIFLQDNSDFLQDNGDLNGENSV
jgi:hypothetical protein